MQSDRGDEYTNQRLREPDCFERKSRASAKKVKIEISANTLERLFVQGQLCAAEFSCLNAESKQVVQSLCLNTCMHRICREEKLKVGEFQIEVTREYT
ncbi:hypothetical protein A1OO_16225 [Enterovibrio norvegicus FF-33]|uniref:Uncharacterized protein n=1 Tax=Enterovibrio norvegicus FF-454 TaxID=1185651 RepID=A0A1E5BVY8_9GAMM|nr:hypothetical protein A1OK_17570 [Enterovibrio norvegicus FF-454]OEE67298.1 hypothetical protein A1OO_16225 [Enterovibrio norvegicus FF-33]OEE88988.1 hypothetical protein A1OQ_12485 [Enterovibrio norvegicus FF-162]